MKTRWLAVSAALVMAAAMVSAPAAQETVAQKEFSKLVGKETLLFADIKDAGVLRSKLDAAGLKQLSEHPQVKAFLDYLKQKAEEAGAGQGPLAEFSLTEILDAADGEVAIAVGELPIDKLIEAASRNEQPEIPDEIYLLVNAKGKAKDFEKVVDKVAVLLTTAGAQKSEEAFRGNTIRRYATDEGGISLVKIGSVFALAPTNDGIKALIRRSGGDGADTLAASERFQDAAKNVGPDADAILYLNLEPLVGGLTKALNQAAERGELGPVGEFVEPLLEATGISNLKSLSFGLNVKADRIDAKAYLSAPGGLKGLAKGFFPAADKPVIPDYAGEKTENFYATQIDSAALYATILDDILGPIAETSGQDAGLWVSQAEAMLGIDLEDDLFGNLAGQVTIVSRYGDGGKEEGVLAIGVKDKKKFTDAIDSIVQVLSQYVPNVQADTKECEGGLLYTFGGEVPAAMGVKEKTVFIGEEESVKQALAATGKGAKTLADDAAFKAMAKLLPEHYQSVGYTSITGLNKILASIKSGEFFKNMEVPPESGFNPQDLADAFDWSKLPDPEVLTKNLAGLIQWTEVSRESVRWTVTAKLKGK
jgi:hypothetical protein